MRGTVSRVEVNLAAGVRVDNLVEQLAVAIYEGSWSGRTLRVDSEATDGKSARSHAYSAAPIPALKSARTAKR